MLNKRGGVEADLTVSVLSQGGDTGPHDPQFKGNTRTDSDTACEVDT